MSKEEEEIKCHCTEECDCGNSCECSEENKCNENCTCQGKEKHEKKCKCQNANHTQQHEEDCECEECSCGDDASKKHSCKESEEYLILAKQIQADFENFRRHAIEDIKQAKIAGQASVIEVFLPCLDTFKEAKKSIHDSEILKGVEMIENKINDALSSLGVEKIESVGEKYNPHVHNVIAVLNVADKENDIIIDEYQAGYVFNGKVIRYAKVIVNKKED